MAKNQAIEEIKETPIWGLYEKGRNYHRLTGVYRDTDRNYRFYNGNQWEGAKLGDVEPVQKNFIKPIVKYKISVVHDNLYAINYSSMNFENREFRKQAERYCDLMNGKAARAWEKDKMDFKGRKITKDAAINDEGILYVDFDRDSMMPVNEIIKKNDIYYGNENEDDIQKQPYILLRKRMSVAEAIDNAIRYGVSADKLTMIIGDNDNFEESGDAAKIELDNMVTVVFKMYKQNGSVHFSAATRWVEILKDQDLGISLYPVAHFNWEEREGSARGEGEVRSLIPNQIEVNRTEVRRVLVVKQQAYPRSVADRAKISNPQAVNTVGGTIWTDNLAVDDVRKIVGTVPPAQMSPDVKQLQDDLIQVTRDLAGAGDIATGQINPESASGRAVLAVAQASRAPMTEQRESYKNFVEDVGRIWMEYWVAYSDNGVDVEEEITDPATGEQTVQLVNIPQSAMKQLQATTKIDITPKGVYDKFAQEQTMENFLLQGFFSANRIQEFKAYVNALPDDSVAPKLRLQEVIENMEEEQRRIAMIETQAQDMQQRFSQFMMDDPDGQASMMADAQAQLMQQGAPQEPEALTPEETIQE